MPAAEDSRADQREGSGVALPLSLFALALFVYTRSIGWGLPAGDETWAADAIKPSAPLAVAWHNFGAHGFNSGWFWFKYPPLHAFLLCALYAPYLLWLWATGGIQGFESDFPFGMTDPFSSLSALALIGRMLSATMGAGSVLLAYLLVVRSFGRVSAVASAIAVTFAYPMVFYSQTTNVEVPYLMWMLASLLGAVRIVEGDERARWWMLLGAGAALSISTKELSAGAFLFLPVAIVLHSLATKRPWTSWLRGGVMAALACVVAIVLANNVLWNPLGFWQRVGFLTQTLPREIALQYAPYYFPIELGGNRGFDVELAQAGKALARLAASLSWPTLLVALAGWLLALRRRPAWALLLLAAGFGYYLVSVRAMLSLSLRYLLPLTVFFAIASGIAVGELLRQRELRALRLVLAGIGLVWCFAYGWDVNRMMQGDGRYAAERWMMDVAAAWQPGRKGAPPAPAHCGADEPSPRVEIYQNRAYLPRFPIGVDVSEIPYEQRGIAEFSARRPHYVVLSSSGLSGVTVRYKQDWADDGEVEEGFSPSQRSVGGQVMNYSRDANREFLDKLGAGELGYESAARFVVEPWIERPLIQSLNPEITIYRRATAPGDACPPLPAPAVH